MTLTTSVCGDHRWDHANMLQADNARNVKYLQIGADYRWLAVSFKQHLTLTLIQSNTNLGLANSYKRQNCLVTAKHWVQIVNVSCVMVLFASCEFKYFCFNMCSLPASIPTGFTLTCLLFSAVELVGPMGRESCCGIWKEAGHIYVVQ